MNINRIANFDIGGGATNIAVYDQGRLVGVSCLDIGARLVSVEGDRIVAIWASCSGRRLPSHRVLVG